MANLPKDAAEAVAWAKSATQAGEQYQGVCDHFVGLAFGLPHSGYDSAKVHWEQSPNKKTDQRPDVGSLVYFDTGKPAGHVAIVTGYDKNGQPLVVTTHTNNGQPTEMPLSAVGLTYLGWAQPTFQGRTAVTIKPEAVPVSADPVNAVAVDDTSGIDTRSKVDGPEPLAKLTKKSLAEEQNISWDYIKQHPDLMQIFQDAVDAGPEAMQSAVGKQNFVNAIQKSSWYQDNNEWARKYLLLKSKGGADYQDELNVARSNIQKEATRIGAVLTPEQVAGMAETYLMNGWNTAGRTQFLTQALTGSLPGYDHSYLDYSQGGVATINTQLKATAAANGVTYDDTFYQGAATAIVNGFGTLDTYVNQIREQAASRYPIYADRIRAGENAADIAKPYVNTMQDMLELAPGTVSLDTPEVRKALGQADPVTGKPAAMGLYDYEQMIRQDPRYKDTKQFESNVVNVGAALAQRWGAI